ncbi:MAG: cupin domain-containing protein [Acidimicrobiales bacterium]
MEPLCGLYDHHSNPVRIVSVSPCGPLVSTRARSPTRSSHELVTTSQIDGPSPRTVTMLPGRDSASRRMARPDSSPSVHRRTTSCAVRHRWPAPWSSSSRSPSSVIQSTVPTRGNLAGMEFDRIDHTQGQLPPEYQPHFQGEARFQRFTSPFGDQPAVFAVHFEAGARTRPHLHRSGQVLHVTAGEGIVATEDGRRTVGPGDVVTVEPGEWHWHGGTPSSAMTHLTVQVAIPGDVDWDVEEGDWASDY